MLFAKYFNMTKFWRNVKLLLTLRDISRKDFARGVQKSEPYLSQLMREDRRTNMPLMEKVAEFFGLSVRDLLADDIIAILNEKSVMDERKWKENDSIDKGALEEKFGGLQAFRLQQIPLLSRIPETRDNLGEFYAKYQIRLVTTEKTGMDMFAVLVPDDSMEDTLQQGDRVVIDPHQPISNGDIVAIRFRDRDCIRIFHEDNSSLICLYCKNSSFPPENIPNDMKKRCFKCIEMHRSLKREDG